uniref:ABC transporter domain-containing protein n=1 Tax=Anopheles epiroticus TaxID=199890 RepID=A0A182PQD2_9DIPT
MSTSNWDKFVLLLWKNWIIQKRHYMQTAFEVTIPVLACSLLILVRGLVTPTVYNEPSVFRNLNVLSLAMIRELLTLHPIELKLAYTPRNEVLDRVVVRAARLLGSDVLHQGYNDSESMYKALVAHNYLAGLEFDEKFQNITSLPERVNVAIRFPSEMRTSFLPGSQFWANWRTFLIFPQFQVYGARAVNASDGGYPANYYAEGFASVQNAISRAILENFGGSNDPLPSVDLQRFPYPPFYDDPLLRGMENLFPSIIMVAFFYSCINTVKFITLEKEKQLKESMKVMGLTGWIHWVAWFVRTLTLLSVSISLVTILLTGNLTTNTNVAIFQFSNRLLVWLFLFVYSITTIMLCFMISTFFSKANIASGIAGIVWFYSLTPFQLTNGIYDSMSLAAKLASSLWSNTAMGYGVMLFMKHEGTSIGLQWDNLFSPVTVDDQLTMAHIFGILLFDAAIYLAVALYVEQIAPGQFGVPRRWNFIFTASFWKEEVLQKKSVTDDVGTTTEEVERLKTTTRYQANMEEDPTDRGIGISLVGLTKIYNDKRATRPAVNGLTVNFYCDQITVLLGHNGAGKSTTMGMLTGMYPPTAGYATIEGHRIGGTTANKFRNTLGFCPQHNVLFDELTVAEHIRFFAKLKGVRQNEHIEAEINKYVQALRLEPKRHEKSQTLSGGMKRKLSLAVALCGSSRIVFCDEPTSGMDPGARRTVWDLLQQEKRDRTIILSTHFMDEADVLGDRIAIMCDGELRAVGTPFYLKKRFGAGYRLVCVKRPNCKPEVVTNLLRRHVPDVVIESDIGTELSLRLHEQHRSKFQPALKELEQNVDQCGISSYGIALSTLEEVFMRLGSDTVNDEEYQQQTSNGTTSNDKKNLTNGTSHPAPPPITITETYELQTGTQLLCSQLRAMFWKKYLSFVRSWKISMLQIMLPTMFVLLAVSIVHFFPNNVVLPPLDITLGSYDRTVTVLSASDTNASMVSAYEETIKDAPGSGQHTLIVTGQSFTDFLLKRSTENIREVDNKYMIGATLDVARRRYTAWFNNKAYHTAPLTLNVLYNAVARTFCTNCSLTVTNKPLPYSTHVRFLRTQSGSNLGFQLAFNTGFAMAFVGALYIMYYVRERATGSKLLQFVSGVNAITFWSVSFLWDFAVYCVAMALYIGFLAAIGEEGWSTAEQLSRVAFVFVCFGLAIIPFTYLGAYFFEVPSTGFIKMLIFNIFTGTVLFTTVFLLKLREFNLGHVADTMEWFYMVFPLFALSNSLNNINVIQTTREICEAYCNAMPLCSPRLACKFNSMCCDVEIFSFSPKGINRNLVFMLGVFVLSFTILLLKEYRILAEWNVTMCLPKCWRNRIRRTAATSSEETESIAIGEDSDVADERTRVDRLFEEREHQSQTGEALLMLRDLTKRYGSSMPPAVDRLTFATGERECFGLLGINGAGKTSTFRMLTGDRSITAGDAWVAGYSLRTQLPAVYRKIGYCPQFDALLEDLTGRETLRIFALLRGIPDHSIASIVDRLAVELHFTIHLDKPVQAYSGGTRRKLSTALALLGDPVVVYLDEPTTGMDPGAKRHFWNVMCRVRSEGRTALVLTSHSMEECEALCTRLAIMVNGEFRCLGSAQHLKNKFSHGYFLTMKLKRTGDGSTGATERRKHAIKSFMQQTFSVSSAAGGSRVAPVSDGSTGAILKEEYHNYLTYHIRDSGLRWSEMFGLLERAREQLQLEDYALGQTSLEQVFLTLTANQRACNE